METAKSDEQTMGEIAFPNDSIVTDIPFSSPRLRLPTALLVVIARAT